MTPREKVREGPSHHGGDLRSRLVRGSSAAVLVLLAVAVAADRRGVRQLAESGRAALESGGLPKPLALADHGRPYRSWFSAPALETTLFGTWHGESALPASSALARDLLTRRPGWTPYQMAALHALLAEAFEGPVPDVSRTRAALAAFDAISWGGRDKHLGAMYATALLALPGEPSGSDRTKLLSRLGAALSHEPYARLGLPSLLSRIRPAQILHALPPNARTLRSAFSALFAAKGPPELLFLVHARWREEVQNERESSLARLGTSAKHDAIRAVECSRLLSLARLDELDDPRSRAQVARILEAWPPGVPGLWTSDPRSAMVKAFSETHAGVVAPGVLLRLAGDLAGLPQVNRARLLALDGRLDEVAAMSAKLKARGDLSWTPVFLAGIDAALARGEPERAAEFAGWLAPAARLECASLISLRELARARRSPELAGLESAVVTAAAIPDSSGLRGGDQLPLCLDPLRSAPVELVVRSEGVSLVAFGWDGYRSDVVVVQGSATLTLDASGLRGRHWLSFSTLGGAGALLESVRRAR